MPEDHPVDFVCGCDARYKVVRVKAEASHADQLIHCLVCKQPLAPTDGAYVLKYFLARRPSRGATSECSFSSGLNYLIDIENTVIAMWRLRLRTYDEVAATKP